VDADNAPSADATLRSRWVRWVAAHDDSWLFTVLYVGLALGLSLAISLFWLVVVVAAHGVLEWFALTQRGHRTHRVGHVLWHLKLDVALVLGALWLGLYLDLLFGMAGLGAVARSGARVTARAVAWQRAVRGALLAADDAALVVRAVAGRGGTADDADPPPRPARPPWRRRWTVGDRAVVGMAITLGVLIVVAPLLTSHSWASAMAALAGDLHPWPARR
jgi:hypothetical protein